MKLADNEGWKMMQRWSSLCRIVFATLLLAQPGWAQDNPQSAASIADEETLVQAILAANSPSQAARNFRPLFKSANEVDLRSLQINPSDTIAVQAVWEEVELTVPVKPEHTVRPDRDKLARFVGFLEGRGRVQPPRWWSEAILDARANRRGNVYAGGLTMARHGEDQPSSAAPPALASFDIREGKSVIRVNSKFALVPEDLQEKLGADNFADGVCSLITSTHCYVAAYDSVGYPYKLACVEQPSGKTRWITEVWASARGGATGAHHQWVEIIEQGNRVAVFGVASSGFHAEVFRVEDGENVLRVSNSYSGW